MSKIFDYNAFEQHFKQVSMQLERRRSKFKLIFIFSAILSALLILGLPFYARPLLQLLLSWFHEIDLMAQQDRVSIGDILALSALVIIASIWIVMMPFKKYRGRNKNAGFLPHHYSLKDHAISQLLRFFGEFQFAPDGGSLLSQIDQATIIPQHQAILSEDNMQGVMHDCAVKFTEAKIIQVYQKRRVAVFSGLMMVIDISDARIKLSGDFSGHTVVISDAKKDLSYMRDHYGQLTRLSLEDARLEAQFEVLTNHPKEAQQIVSEPFLNALNDLHSLLKNTTQQTEHWDSKLFYMVDALLDRLPNPLKWLPGRFAGQKLPKVANYDAAFEAQLDMTKDDPIARHRLAMNQQVHAEFFNDKILITIPYEHDLFETNSLFSPAINSEDGRILFSIMHTLDVITADIRKYLANR